MRRRVFSLALIACLAGAACSRVAKEDGERGTSHVPRGYMSVIRIDLDGGVMRVGPFVGYYFKPEDPRMLNRLDFICFNERSFYTRDVPPNARIFEGTARLVILPKMDFDLPADDRINPVFAENIPEEWLATRPEPRTHFRHFHSGYDAAGPVAAGYWLEHVAVTSFVYDMGGRVGANSPLYHEVDPGVDTEFALIMEFDRGPQ